MVADATTSSSSDGLTLNHAAADRTVASPGMANAVVSSPQRAPLMYWTCCIRSSPVFSWLIEPFWMAFGGTEYPSEPMTMLERVGELPSATSSRFVTAHTPIWLTVL